MRKGPAEYMNNNHVTRPTAVDESITVLSMSDEAPPGGGTEQTEDNCVLEWRKSGFRLWLTIWCIYNIGGKK